MGEDLLRHSTTTEPSDLRQCPYDHKLTNKAYLSGVTVRNIYGSFTHKMAAKTSWHRYGTKWRHCHHMYFYLHVARRLHVPSVLWRCWLGGRKGIRPVKKLEWWGVGLVICLERGADLHVPSWCHCHSLSLASVKSRLVLSFWYRLTRVCVCVCVCVCCTSPTIPTQTASPALRFTIIHNETPCESPYRATTATKPNALLNVSLP